MATTLDGKGPKLLSNGEILRRSIRIAGVFPCTGLIPRLIFGANWDVSPSVSLGLMTLMMSFRYGIV